MERRREGEEEETGRKEAKEKVAIYSIFTMEKLHEADNIDTCYCCSPP